MAYHKRQMYTMKTTLIPTQGKKRASFFLALVLVLGGSSIFFRVVDREVNVMGIEV